MNKNVIVDFLNKLQNFSDEKGNIRRARQECAKQNWDQITLEKIEWGISLFHNKPSMLSGYLNEMRNQDEKGS